LALGWCLNERGFRLPFLREAGGGDFAFSVSLNFFGLGLGVHFVTGLIIG
jgi:hypothetical protein